MFPGAIAPSPDVAFAARYYFQGKKKSYYQIYVVNHDGSGRRQLTFGARDTDNVAWVDKDHVTYSITSGFKQVKDRYTQNIAIRIIDIHTGREREVASYKDVESYQVGTVVNIKGNGGEKAYRITSTGMKPTAPEREEDYQPFGYVPTKDEDQADFLQRRYSLLVANGSQEFEWKVDAAKWEFEKDDVFSVSMRRNDQTSEFKFKGHSFQTILRGPDNATYFVSQPAFSKFMAPRFVYRWPDSESSPKLIVSNIGNIKFDPNQELWLGDDIEQRRLLPLKDGRVVYVNSLYCGNWKTGKRWTIATGLVSVYEASVRPKE